MPIIYTSAHNILIRLCEEKQIKLFFDSYCLVGNCVVKKETKLMNTAKG